MNAHLKTMVDAATGKDKMQALVLVLTPEEARAFVSPHSPRARQAALASMLATATAAMTLEGK